MQPTNLSVSEIFEELHEKLQWKWVAAEKSGLREFDANVIAQARSSVDLVGYLNFIHPHRIPVLGIREIEFFQHKIDATHPRPFEDVIAGEPPVIILGDGQNPLKEMLSLCEQHAVPLWVTKESSAYVIDVLRSYLAKSFASRTSMHGVFMNIFGMGVMIQGESGLGKSELGLELISRGHGLVADDVVDFSLIAQGVVEGQCPELLENLLEVRGIGLLNIRTIFGETAMRRRMRLRLVVRLVRRENWDKEFERLPTDSLSQEILGVPIREIAIPVQAGRNIAVLVEAGVRNTILQMQGIDTFKEFMLRQQQEMSKGKEPRG